MTENRHTGPYGKLPEDKLLAYLEGKLNAEEQREVEAMLNEEGMESDAMEGLNEMPPPDAKQVAARINHKLQYDLRKNRFRKKSLFADNKWSWLAVMIIMILVMLGYLVIKMT